MPDRTAGEGEKCFRGKVYGSITDARGNTPLVLLPDSGERYLSTQLSDI
jgi:hypothetical protein